MKKWIGIVLGLMLIASPAWALAPSAGAVVSFSDSQVSPSGMRLFQVSYTTHASAGTFTCNTDKDITGWIILVETDPASGAPQPDDNYDIVLNNANGRDVMGGALANRDETNTEATMPILDGNYMTIWNEGPLAIQVTNAGNSLAAELLIYYLP